MDTEHTTRSCSHCGEDDASVLRDLNLGGWMAETVCEDCIESHLERCDECGRYQRGRELTSVAWDVYACRDCIDQHYLTCTACDGLTHDSQISLDYAGDPICEECQSNLYTRCVNCDEMVPCEEDESCPSCGHGGVVDGINGLYNYSYKPELTFYSGASARPSIAPIGRRGARAGRPAPYFGLEIEVEGMHCVRSDIVDSLPARGWYAKEDGSLDDGVEMVSHPGDIEYWRHPPHLDWLRRVATAGGRSYDTSTCGMHIHVNRRALTALEWYRVVLLSQRAPKLMRRASRRPASNFDEWAPLERYDHTPALLGKVLRHGGRRGCVNMTPGQTVEFRLFRGTLHPTAARRNIELVNAILHYAQHASMQHIGEVDFYVWLQRRGQYVIGTEAARELRVWLFGEVEGSQKPQGSARTGG